MGGTEAVSRARQVATLVIVLALSVAACDSPRPTPTAEPTQAAAESPDATLGSTNPPASNSSPRPLNPSPAPTPTSVDLIEAALEAGRIDEPTAHLYRFYAQWGDARLPEEYRTGWSEDEAGAVLADQALADLSPDQEAMLRPFLVRPTDPDSYWSSDAVGGVASSGHGTARLANLVTTPTCSGAWARLDLSIPVSIWGRCRTDASGAATIPLSAAMTKVSTFMADLWPRMTAMMGTPIPDRFLGTTQAANEPAEAGDGRLDVYIVESPTVSYLRDVTNDALAVTRTAPPYNNGTSSAYMVVDPTKAASDAIFKSNVAHEFFHVLSDRYNATKKFFCRYPAVGGTCGSSNESHWFSEASATWAEHHFVPEARPTEIYAERLVPYMAEPVGLAAGGLNRYESFMWLLFMEQESSGRERAIADAWKAFLGKDTWSALQAGVDAQLKFESHFRDFAVRVWNEKLEPGDPISPRFQAIDPGFPLVQPSQGDPAPRFREPAFRLDPFVHPSESFSEDLPELWAAYYDLTPDTLSKRLTLNFAGLRPNPNLDVDALVYVHDIGWERRKLDPLLTEICLDKAKDAFQQVILILSNHSQQPNDHVRGSWTAQVDAGGCATVSDGLVYTSSREVGQPGGGEVYQKRVESLTLRLNLKANDGTTEYLAQFLNNGSTFQAGIDTETIVPTVDPSCSLVSEGHGGGGGTVPGLDGVVASLSQVFEPVPGGSIGPDGRWVLTVAGGVQIDVTTSETSCIGSSSSVFQDGVGLPPCDGTEVVGPAAGSGAGRLFDFNCSFSSPGYSWSLTGKVRLSG